MSRRRRIPIRSRWSIPVAGILAALIALIAAPATTSAHPLDQYLQISYITVEPTQIQVELDFTPGVLLASTALPAIDTNGDQSISEAEAQAYAATIVEALSLSIDGQRVPLTMTSVEMPGYLNIQAGYGLTKIIAVADLPADTAGEHELTFSNAFEPALSKYQVNGFVNDTSSVQLGTQDRDDKQQSMTMGFVIGGASASTTDEQSTQVSVGTSLAGAGHAQRLMTYFESSSNTPTALLVALGIALLLGSLHALTPGHGKTLVAAYLVGSRGTVKHAVALGAIVTFTHTSSVIVIGLIALFASHYIMPSVLVPALEVISGLLVVFLGGRLIWSRLQTYRTQRSDAATHSHDLAHVHAHVHDHELDHEHSHKHDETDDVFWHDHGDGHVHSHAMPETVSARSLAAMGISGGMVPCPEALGIMIIAIGLHRIALGLGLIVAFSFGLAAVLIGIGILLVRSRMMMEKFGFLGSRLTGSVLPLASAVIVTVLGVGIVFGGLSSYLG